MTSSMVYRISQLKFIGLMHLSTVIGLMKWFRTRESWHIAVNTLNPK